MGAWGHGSFDNDTALDWVTELDESDDHRLVLDALAVVTRTPASEYLDADLCCDALAGAEVVAASRGKPHPSAPDAVATFVQRHPQILGSRGATAARAAVTRIRDHSELRELWSDSDDFADWIAGMDDLLARLA